MSNPVETVNLSDDDSVFEVSDSVGTNKAVGTAAIKARQLEAQVKVARQRLKREEELARHKTQLEELELQAELAAIEVEHSSVNTSLLRPTLTLNKDKSRHAKENANGSKIVDTIEIKDDEDQPNYINVKLLTELIEKCLELDDSEAMKKIIYSNLLTCYQETHKKYKESPLLQRVLSKTIKRLEAESSRKFFHIRNLCETLRLHSKDNIPNGNGSTVRESKIVTVINLDDDDDVELMDVDE